MNTASPRESSEAELAKNRAGAKALLDEQKAACNADYRVVNTKSVESFNGRVLPGAAGAELDAKSRLCALGASAVRENMKREEGRDAEHRGEPPRSPLSSPRFSLETWRARELERESDPPPSPMESPDPKGGASTEHPRPERKA